MASAVSYQTARLLLSPLGTEDAETVFSLTSDERVAKYMRFDTQVSVDQAEALIREYAENGNHGFLVTERANATPVGVFAFKQDTEEPRHFFLSIFLRPERWGLGYGGELFIWAAEYGRDTLRARALTAYVFSDNIGSRLSLERGGFQEYQKLSFDDLPNGLLVYRRGL